MGKPLAVLFNKDDIAQIHPSTIIERLDILDRFDRPHRVFSSTAKEPERFIKVLTWVYECLSDISPLPDRSMRFFTIFILDMLNEHEEGLPILSVLGQLEIISRTGQVKYDRDKIMALLRKLLSIGEIQYIKQAQVLRITEKGLEKLQSEELVKGSKYEKLKLMIEAKKASSPKQASFDKNEKDFLDEFELDELAELYKKATTRKRKI